MAGNQDQMDQDAIAAQWEASLDSEDPSAAAEEAAANELSESMALQWAAMVEDGGREFGNKNSGERVLSQEEIDNLLGFTVGDVNLDDHSGIRAIIDSAMVSYERLPMLEIVFDRLVRLMTTSLRNFTSDNVEVSLDRITSVRFGDYMNSIPLPAVLCVFKAEEWENFGLATVDSSLIYSMIDVLPRSDLGGPFRDRGRAGADFGRCRALRGRYSAERADEAESRRHPAAGDERRGAGRGALRQRDPDRGADGAGRRSRRHPRHQATAQAEYHLRDVREGR